MSYQKAIFILSLVTLIALGVMAVGPPTRILGGMYANPAEFPHAVSFRRKGSHFCGGSIIDSRHILTAAHCVQGIMQPPYSDIMVVSGTNSLSRGGTAHKIKRATCHPSYKPNPTEHPVDIAVVTLTAPIVFNTVQSAIKLASKETYEGLQGIAIGWGRSSNDNHLQTENLQKLYTTVQYSSVCLKYLTAAELNKQLVCTYQGVGMGTCNGDSGSSVIVNGEVVGVTSFGLSGKCAIGFPEYHTKVFPYRAFIHSEMKKN